MAGSITTEHPAYQEMARRWRPIDALLGGTLSMRDSASGSQSSNEWEYLPAEPKEDKESYRRRVGRSFLYGMLSDTIRQTVSRPFSRSVMVEFGDNPPPWLDSVLRNADGSGKSFHHTLREAMNDGLAHGLTHAIVDLPQIPVNISRAEFRKSARPLIALRKADSVFNWRSRTSISGETELAHVRIREKREVQDGMETKCVDAIRCYDAPGEVTPNEVLPLLGDAPRPAEGEDYGVWYTYQQDEKGEFRIVEAGYYTAPTTPIETWYIDRSGFLAANPPYEELAWVNIAHWQRFSDYMSSCRQASVAHLALFGFSEKEQKEFLKGGSSWSRAIIAERAEAKAEVVEHSGKAIESLERCLRALEQRAEVLGMRPSLERVGVATATQASLNSKQTMTTLHAWIEDGEEFGKRLLQRCYQAMGEEPPPELKVEIHSDFDAQIGNVQMIQALSNLYQIGGLSLETLIRETRRLGGVGEDVSVEDEVERIEDKLTTIAPAGGAVG